jgi:Tfp pilus assembly protein PilN
MVNIINFLPCDYMERRGRRRDNIICLIIGGLAAVGLGLAGMLAAVTMFSSAGMRAVVEKQYQEATLQIKQLKDLEERKAGLVHKVELSSDLLERVPRSTLLARLTNYLPQKASLTALVLKLEDVEVPAPRSTAQPPAAAAKANRTRSRSSSGPSTPRALRRRTCRSRSTSRALPPIRCFATWTSSTPSRFRTRKR